MGLLEITEGQYYQQLKDSGNYQFTSLNDIINQFMIVYIGQDKMITKASRTEVAFHAQRAMQELSFDTFKSVKSQELKVPPSLSVMLPQDYVNYTNISWVDASGIHHTIHPTSKTSNPQQKGNLIENTHFHLNTSGWTLGTGWEWDNVGSGDLAIGGSIIGTDVALGQKVSIPVNIRQGLSYKLRYYIAHPDPDVPGVTDSITETSGNIKVSLYGDEGYASVHTTNNNPHSGAGLKTSNLYLNNSDKNFITTTDTDSKLLVLEPYDTAFTGVIDRITLTELHDVAGNIERFSTSWNSYKDISSRETNDNYEDDTWWPYVGGRYGLDPQHAQANGSFFIEPGNNKLYLSSNLSSKTIVIKYISDGLAKEEDMIVHKFAEEAMYKWIACGILSTKAGIPEYAVRRYKKERFAAVRQAKLRLSNIKIEEITQILRGKSKQIKH